MSELLEMEGFDFESRQLCADGSCTGLLGENGHCRVCGRAAGEELHERGEDELAPSTLADEDFDARRLCPDGSCTGLLAADGVCKLCGGA